MLQSFHLVFSTVLLILSIIGFVTVLPAYAIAPTIAVGSSPYDIAIDDGTQKIYVVNSDDGTVSVIDAATNTVTNTITEGTLPYGVVVDPTTHLIYVANNGANSVSIVNPLTSSLVPVSVGRNPTSVAVDPAKNQAYVTNTGDGTVSIINLATKTVSSTVTVGSSPYGITVDPTTHLVYVSNTNSDTISVMDPTANLVKATITLPAGSSPYNMVIDHNRNKLYVTDNSSDSVSVVDLATNVVTATVTLPTGSLPYGIDMDAISNLIYVSNFGTSSLSVINPASNSIVGVIQVGAAPYSIGIDQTTHKIYSVNFLGNTVSVIDPLTLQVSAITPTITIASFPSQPIVGQPATLTATLNSATATGTIQFSANGTNIGSPVTVTAGVASLSTSSLDAGINEIGAVYVSYSANYTGASKVTSITVTAPSTGHVNGQGGIANGQAFEFDVVANADKVNGHLNYSDTNAAISLSNKTVTSLVIDDTQKSATFAGQATLSGGITVSNFVVQVTDPDLTGLHDTLSIAIYGSAGNLIYQNSGMVQGHVQIQKMVGYAHDHHVSSQIWFKMHLHAK